jgi:hypothetical protein
MTDEVWLKAQEVVDGLNTLYPKAKILIARGRPEGKDEEVIALTQEPFGPGSVVLSFVPCATPVHVAQTIQRMCRRWTTEFDD